MNVICSNEDVNSHFCDVFEIENAWISSGVRAWMAVIGLPIPVEGGYPAIL
jgi:hypothetical protein